MRAYRLTAWGTRGELVRVPRPRPGPGQVLVQVAGAGVCQSDLHVMAWQPAEAPWALPFTLGHETAGWVAELGDGVEGWSVGDAVLVCGAWGCGRCRPCARGTETLCENAAELGTIGGGLGRDGGMAEHLLVPSGRLLVPLGGLDPALFAPLADAGLTPYHALQRALTVLTPGTSAVVLGVGGLGHMAVQMARVLTPAQVVAVDTDAARLELARELGAHEAVLGGAGALDRLRAATGGAAAAVLDVVGTDETLALAQSVVAGGGHVAIVGHAGGAMRFGYGLQAWDVTVSLPFWGSRPELLEVVALARSGAVRLLTEQHPLDAAPAVYERLAAGQVHGRAVLVP